MSTSPQRPAHFAVIPFQLLPLTPIHIGSGEGITPMEYRLEPEPAPGRGCRFFVQDLSQLLAALNPDQRKTYYELIEKDDIPALRHLLRSVASAEQFCRFQIRGDRRTFEQMEQTIHDPNRMGEIELMTRCASTQRPLIPGSSLKGALRTSMIARWAHLLEEDEPARFAQLQPLAKQSKNSSSDFEAAVMASTRETGRADQLLDPFRQLHIEDLFLSPLSTSIRQIKIVRRHGSRQGSQQEKIQIWREVTDSVATGQLGDQIERGYVGQIRIYPRLVEPAKRKRPERDPFEPNRQLGGDLRGELPLQIDLAEILKSAQGHYDWALGEDLSNFCSDKELVRTLDWIRQRIEQDENQSCLIRVGRHSHFESVTVGEEFAQPPEKGFGKTRSMVDGMYPLGFAWLRFGRPRISSQR